MQDALLGRTLDWNLIVEANIQGLDLFKDYHGGKFFDDLDLLVKWYFNLERGDDESLFGLGGTIEQLT